MKEQQDVQTALAEVGIQARKAIEDIASQDDMPDVEARRAIAAIEQRITEAGMLLSLATGTNQPVTLHAQHLLGAVLEADKAARVVLNTDIDISQMTEEQQAEALQMMELAEEGYNQWRALSALALMHLSDIFRRVDKASHVADR